MQLFEKTSGYITYNNFRSERFSRKSGIGPVKLLLDRSLTKHKKISLHITNILGNIIAINHYMYEI